MRKHRQMTEPDDRVLRLFAYLDGELDREARKALEAELAGSSALSGELARCRALYAALDGLQGFAPSPDFKARVMAAISAPAPLWIRARDWLFGAPGATGFGPNPFAATHESGLTARQARALAAFVASDPEAGVAAREWRSLMDRLDSVPHLAPSQGFGDRVMARLAAETVAQAEPSRVTLAQRLNRLWPRRRERLAAISGVAFGPTAVVAATAYMILSNPLVTPSNLLSFLWAKGSTVVVSLAETLFGGALESGAVGGVYAFLTGIPLSGATLALGLAAFGGLTALSGWILYRNVIKVTSMDRHYAAV